MESKKYLAIGLAALCALSFTSCSNKGDSSSGSASSLSSSQSNSLITQAVVENQLALPEKGEEIAVFDVEGYGSFSCRLFKDAAPKAVENFIELAKAGKYNGLPFHRVIEDFMVQGGDTTQNGGDGKSIYGNGFAVELNESLHHFNGALAVARSNSYTTGQSTQFYIVSSKSTLNYTDSDFDNVEQQVDSMHKQEGQSGIQLKLSKDVRDKYKSVGGYPSLDMSYTVFGQTFKGQDVVDKIAGCPKDQNVGSDGSQSVPNPKVILSSVQIETYNG